MSKPKTNFAWILNLLGARPRDLCEAVGADKSLVSRWYNGKQKLMPNHAWIDPVADYLLQLDDKLKSPIIPSILSTYYPSDDLSSRQSIRDLLLRWLAQTGHKPADSPPELTGVAGLIKDKIDKLEKVEISVAQELQEYASKNTVTYGIKGVQATALQLIELITNDPESQELLFVCPEGLDMLTRDRKFHPTYLNALVEMFAAGNTLTTVLRTDFRLTDIFEFSGPWLVAHLKGSIHSYYYDDYNNFSKVKMLAVVPGVMAAKVSEADNGEIYTSIQFDKNTVNEIYELALSYKERSEQRFHYNLFEHSDSYLRGIYPFPEKLHYRIVRFPHLGIASVDILKSDFSLSDEEIDTLENDYPALILGPDYYHPETSVRHLFCENDIEEALLKNRHTCSELSSIFDRRIMMKTQDLINRLILMKKLLEKHKNYEVSFLPDEIFQKITMQIACWGDRVAIGWIPGGTSTACKDYMNVHALTGFCNMAWERIPGIAKSRATAFRKINTWLKKAAKYGYEV